MIRAHRRPDGRYRLEIENRHAPNYDFAELKRWVEVRYHDMVNEGVGQDGFPEWTCREDSLATLGVEKVFGVLAGPSSCGCEPIMFRWVTESEVKAGRTATVACRRCAERIFHVLGGTLRFVAHICDIIEIMGEADVARETYEAEFAGKYEGVTG